MIQNKTLALALAGAFAIGGTGVLYAQSQEHGMGMMNMMGDCPMMGTAAEAPSAALQHRDTLGLTPDQIAQLESLQEGIAEAREDRMAHMRDVHVEIAEAATGEEFSEGAARDAFRRMGDLHTEMGMEMLRARHESRQVLTAEQREILAGLPSGAMGMGPMQGMGGMMEMMEDCPMMEGGMMHEGMEGMGMQGDSAPPAHHQHN